VARKRKISAHPGFQGDVATVVSLRLVMWRGWAFSPARNLLAAAVFNGLFSTFSDIERAA
jgi:hypothetical protein